MTPRALLPVLALAWAAAACGTSKPPEQQGAPQASQTQTPVTWTAAASIPDGGSGTVTLDATIEKGWHVYSITQPAGGPIPTRITLPPDQGVSVAGAVRVAPPPRTQFDSAFSMNVEEHELHAQFAVPLSVASSPAPDSVRVNVRYQACNSSLCLPPQTAHLTAVVSSRRGTATRESH